MATNSNPALVLDLSVNDLASAALKRIEDGIGRLSGKLGDIPTGQRTLAPLAHHAGQANQRFSRLSQTLNNLAGAYVGFSMFSSLTTDLVSSVAAIQQLNTRLQALTEGADAYNQTWSYLNDTADDLSADVNMLADSYSKLGSLVICVICHKLIIKHIFFGLKCPKVSVGTNAQY